MDRFHPDNYQDDLDDYLAGGMSAPSQPGNLADDAERQAYLDQLTAQLLASLQLNIPQPDFSRATPATDVDPRAANFPATGTPRMRRY